jgi:hypothetical protein
MIYQQLVVSMETFPLLRLPEAKDSPGFDWIPLCSSWDQRWGHQHVRFRFQLEEACILPCKIEKEPKGEKREHTKNHRDPIDAKLKAFCYKLLPVYSVYSKMARMSVGLSARCLRKQPLACGGSPCFALLSQLILGESWRQTRDGKWSSHSNYCRRQLGAGLVHCIQPSWIPGIICTKKQSQNLVPRFATPYIWKPKIAMPFFGLPGWGQEAKRRCILMHRSQLTACNAPLQW